MMVARGRSLSCRDQADSETHMHKGDKVTAKHWLHRHAEKYLDRGLREAIAYDPNEPSMGVRICKWLYGRGMVTATGEIVEPGEAAAAGTVATV